MNNKVTLASHHTRKILRPWEQFYSSARNRANTSTLDNTNHSNNYNNNDSNNNNNNNNGGGGGDNNIDNDDINNCTFFFLSDFSPLSEYLRLHLFRSFSLFN
jgi:hypothetical protein